MDPSQSSKQVTMFFVSFVKGVKSLYYQKFYWSELKLILQFRKLSQLPQVILSFGEGDTILVKQIFKICGVGIRVLKIYGNIYFQNVGNQIKNMKRNFVKEEDRADFNLEE